MQLYSTASVLKARPASDAPASDARTASDPANGKAFRTALNAAHQNAGSTAAQRTPSRPDATDQVDDDSSASEAEPATDAAMSADELAALLMWLAAAPATPTTVTPTATITAGDGDAPAGTVTTASATEIASPASLTAPLTTADLLAATTTADGADGQTDPLTAFARSQADATLAGALPPTSGGIPLPIDALTDTTTSIPLPIPSTPDGSKAAQATAATTSATQALDQSVLNAAQATAATTAATADGGTSVADQTAASAATTPATTWSSLAAAVYPDVGGGARIAAATNPTATRSSGPTSPLAGPNAPVDDAQIPTTGSTAQAAGAVTTTGIELPGQAVTAAGASSQSTSGTFAEALAAGPTGVTSTRSGQNGAGASTDINAAAFGAAGASGVGQAQTTSTTHAGAASAPAIATQVADLALAASRHIGQSVEMVLQPEGLGTISLRVSMERDGLGVHIAVDNPQAREMVQASWPQLQQALDQRGLSVHSMLLDLSNGQRNGEAFQTFQQFNNQQFTGQQSRGGSSSADRRGSSTVTAVDEGTRLQPGAGTSSRVDYRI